MTPATLYREGDDLEALLAQIDREHVGQVRVVEVTYPRQGGVMGFFARQRIGVRYEVLDADAVTSVVTSVAPVEQESSHFADLIAAAESAESHAFSAPSVPAPVGSTPAVSASSQSTSSVLAAYSAVSTASVNGTANGSAGHDGPTLPGAGLDSPEANAGFAAMIRELAAQKLAESPAPATLPPPPEPSAMLRAITPAPFVPPTLPSLPPPAVLSPSIAAPTADTGAQPEPTALPFSAILEAAEAAAAAQAAVAPPFVPPVVPPAVAPVPPAVPPIESTAPEVDETASGDHAVDETPTDAEAPQPVTMTSELADAPPSTTADLTERPAELTEEPADMTPDLTDEPVEMTPAPVEPAHRPRHSAPATAAPTPTGTAATHATTGADLTLRRKLSDLGVPISMIPDRATDPFRVIDHLVHALPPAPAVPTGPSDVLVIAGPAAAALRAAESTRARLRLRADQVWTAGVPADLATAGRIIDDQWHAISVTAESRLARRGATIIVVAVDEKSDDSGHDNWAAAVIRAVVPDALWIVVDATRKPSDSRAQIAALGGSPSGLIVTSAQRTSSPASVWALGLPVALLDGRPATRGAWAVLLIDKLTELEP